MGSTHSLFLKLYDKRSAKKPLLTDAELIKLKKILIDMTDKDATGITFDQMRNYLHFYMSSSIIERLYEAMQWKHDMKRSSKRIVERNTVSPIAFVYVLANIIKGDLMQKAQIIRFMVGGRDTGFTTSLDLHSFIQDLLSNHLQTLSKHELLMVFDTDSEEAAKERLALSLLQDLLDPDSIGNTLPTLTEYDDKDLARFLENNLIILYLIHQLMYPPFPIYQSTWQSFLPTFLLPEPDESERYTTSILDVPSIIFLNLHIPRLASKTHEWMLVCSSSDVDKFSFEEVISCCSRYENTLFIIEDSDLYRFGGFSSDKLFVCPKFRGSLGCFVFSLVPYMSVYKSTGINKNWIYLNDFTHKDETRCLGFGGNDNLFAFSVQSDCKTGVSYPTLTYNSPQLASKTNFTVSKFEIWAIFRSKAMRPSGWKTSPSRVRQFRSTSSLVIRSESRLRY